ncbi:hypothetical protein PFTANZ_06266, partial [Plasmodium falciparum Tanzania (2000708)]
MVRTVSAGGGKDDYKDATNVKELLDKIGQQVYEEKVKNGADAKNYIEALKGNLQAAKGIGELAAFPDTCKRVEQYYKRLNGKRYPCEKRSPVRFSDESRSQCTHNRIKDSNKDDNKCGACAPYRRLHLCDYNLEKMGRTSTTKHDLLAEVCMAAKYEGDSIKTHYTIHQQKYGDSQICTELARSFADIGDIIRGKDLYLSYDKKEKEQRDKIEKNLQKIFGNIYNEVMRGKNVDALQKRYGSDKENYFQLREDWWTANRETVWEALTCDVDGSYFRATCGDSDSPSQAQKQCRCGDGKSKAGKTSGDVSIVPTYFDYVPQFLRWFEEWAEDFCRKRKHKLQNAIKKCRGDSGNERYCSRNGYDCTKTIRGINQLVSDPECTNCSLVCTPFVDWIDNKKKEFEKQKNKYDKEIEKKDQTKTTITIGDKTINNWYVKEFYERLNQTYGDVKKFLGLLNQETTCKDPPTIGKETASKVDFTNDKIDEIFSHTEYCETCPWCETKVKNQDGKWTDIPHIEGCQNNVIKDLDNNESAVIRLLLKDKDGKTMVEKLGGLCGNGAKKNNIQEKTWKCHYEGSGKHYCILQDEKTKRNEQTIMPYYVLFLNWINEMLKDSIDWSKELKTCINNEKPTNCIRECKSKCDCFQKWVQHMRTEWQQLEEHYEKEDFYNDFTAYRTLELYLQTIYLEMIQKDYAKEKPVEEMKKIIENNNIMEATRNNNSINTFLQQEEQKAKNC